MLSGIAWLNVIFLRNQEDCTECSSHREHKGYLGGAVATGQDSLWKVWSLRIFFLMLLHKGFRNPGGGDPSAGPHMLVTEIKELF